MYKELSDSTPVVALPKDGDGEFGVPVFMGDGYENITEAAEEIMRAKVGDMDCGLGGYQMENLEGYDTIVLMTPEKTVGVAELMDEESGVEMF